MSHTIDVLEAYIKNLEYENILMRAELKSDSHQKTLEMKQKLETIQKWVDKYDGKIPVNEIYLNIRKVLSDE